LGDALKWAIVLVLAVWLVRFLAWALPQWTAGLNTWMNSRPARAAAAAAVVAAAATAGTPPAENQPGSPPDGGTAGQASGKQEGGASHG
jgi:NhaP-type Na+/H+ or K+/H+ antiporter